MDRKGRSFLQGRFFFGFLLALILFGTSTGVFAEEGFKNSWGWTTMEHLAGGIFSNFYDSTKKEFRWEGPAFVGVTGLSSFLAYRFLDNETQPSNPNQVLGSFGPGFSQTMRYLPYGLPIGFFLSGQLLSKENPSRAKTLETAEMLAESLALTFATTFVMKNIINRERPNGNGHSFPSGHTSANFAAAGVLAMQYPWYVGMPALAAASVVGFSRIDGQNHYLSDVVMGAGVGLFFSTSVHFFHSSRKNQSKKGKKENPSFMPLITENTYGLSIMSAF